MPGAMRPSEMASFAGAWSDAPDVAPEHPIQDDVVEPPPTSPWRCMRCHKDEFEMLHDTWRCLACGSHEYYHAHRHTKTVTPSGVWMFVPHAAGSSPSHAPSDGPPRTPVKRQRRRKNRVKKSDTPPDGDDDDELGEDREQAESEVPTLDPIIEPTPPPSIIGGKTPRPAAGPGGPSTPGPRPSKKDDTGLHPRGSQVPVQPRGKLNPRLPRPDVLPQQPDPVLPDLPGTDRSTTGGKKKKQDDESDRTGASWNSKKGPEPGIKWKTGQYPPVPVWKYDASDMRAFAKFKKKIEIWQLQMRPYATGKDQALLLYNSLTGEPEQELEHLSVEELYVENGVSKILELLQRPFEQRHIYQKRRFLQDFEGMRRFAGESMRAYVLRFRRVMRSLRAVGIEINATFDEEALGSRLLDRSGLSHSDQRMVLVGTQQSLAFETIAETLALQWPEFRPPPPIFTKEGKGYGKQGKSTMSQSSSSTTSLTSTAPSSRPSSGKGTMPRRVFMTETVEEEPHDEADPAEGEHLAPEADEGDNEPPEEDEEPELLEDDEQGDLELQELANVLTVTARKLSGVTLGRKFTTGAKKAKKSPE